MSWSKEQETLLRKFWSDVSLSCAQIAEQMGKTKSAISGKAERMGLSKRPSPIFKSLSGKPTKQRSSGRLAIAGSTLPVLPSLEGFINGVSTAD